MKGGILMKKVELLNLKGNQAVIISGTIRPIWNGGDQVNDIATEFETARASYMTNANAYITAMNTIYNNLKNR